VLGSFCGCRFERVFGQVVLGVSASHVSAHIEIAGLPEALQILSHLDGSVGSRCMVTGTPSSVGVSVRPNTS